MVLDDTFSMRIYSFIDYILIIKTIPRGDPGFKSRMCPPYPHASRKRRLKWGAVI